MAQNERVSEMSYSVATSAPGEIVRYRAKISLVVFTIPFALLAAGAQAWLNGSDWAGFWLTIGAISLASVWLRRWTTEIVVTDRRIIFKRGFFRREVFEMDVKRIESVRVHQSIFGRMFDYGNITVRGIGAGIEPMNLVAEPLALRAVVADVVRA